MKRPSPNGPPGCLTKEQEQALLWACSLASRRRTVMFVPGTSLAMASNYGLIEATVIFRSFHEVEYGHPAYVLAKVNRLGGSVPPEPLLLEGIITRERSNWTLHSEKGRYGDGARSKPSGNRRPPRRP